MGSSWDCHRKLLKWEKIIQDLKKVPIIPFNEQVGKIERSVKILSLLESHKVLLSKFGGGWISDFERESLIFPYANHDDQVDSFTQFLTWAHQKTHNQYKISIL